MAIFLLVYAAASAAILAVHLALAAGLLLNLARDRRAARDGGGPLSLVPEVIVAVRNEEKTLPALLASLGSQTRVDCLFLLVDDRSTDGTGRLLEGFREAVGPRARILHNSEEPAGLTGKQAALDLAFAAARGDVLVFTDGDCVLPPTWVERMLGCFRDPAVGVALGRIELREAPFFLGRFQAFEQPLINQYNLGSTGIGVPMGCFGNNMAVRRAALKGLGGFRAMGYSVTEDAMLLDAICRGGAWKARATADWGAAARTAPKATWGEYLDQHTRWNAGALFSSDPVTRLAFILVVLVYLTSSLIVLPLGFLDWRIPLLSLTSFVSIGLLGVIGGFYGGKDRRRYFARFFPFLFLFAFFYVFVTLRALVRRPFDWKGSLMGPGRAAPP